MCFLTEVACADTVRLGVLAWQGEQDSIERWQPTADFLSEYLADHQFIIVPLTLDNIRTHVEQEKIDFLLTNTASYAELEAEYGVSRLVTLRRHELGKTFSKFGSVIFTRADHPSIRTLEDLRGKSFMAVHEEAFGGWWMAWRELKTHGVERNDLSKLSFSGFPQSLVVDAVRNGQADAGTVRTGVLEALVADGQIDLSQFRIINAGKQSDFPFLHSTRLYPEWPFAMLKHTNEELANRVAVALLSTSFDDTLRARLSHAEFTVPLDYKPVLDLMSELNVGPFAQVMEPSWRDFVAKYWGWLVGILATVLALLGITTYVTALNRQLDNARRSSQAQTARIGALYSVSALPGMSIESQLAEVLKTACELLELKLGVVTRKREENQPSDIIAEFGTDELRSAYSRASATAASPAQLIVEAQDAVMSSDPLLSQWDGRAAFENCGLGRFIVAPIRVKDRLYGSIELYGLPSNSNTFAETDRYLIQLIARWAGVALERHERYETEKARDAEAEANKTKNEFLAIMSHELRTPLNAVMGYSDLLKEELLAMKREDLCGDIEKIHGAAQTLLGLIEQILQLTKIEAGRVEVLTAELEIGAFVGQVADAQRRHIENNGSTLTVKVDSSLDTMAVDQEKLEIILAHLLRNAAKFTQNGQVTLAVLPEPPDTVMFEVKDTGIGIAQNQLHKLFKPFSQVDSSSTRHYGGAGLGLALSMRFAHMMGGSIEVSSTPGAGSAFRLRLPRHGLDPKTRQPVSAGEVALSPG